MTFADALFNLIMLSYPKKLEQWSGLPARLASCSCSAAPAHRFQLPEGVPKTALAEPSASGGTSQVQAEAPLPHIEEGRTGMLAPEARIRTADRNLGGGDARREAVPDARNRKWGDDHSWRLEGGRTPQSIPAVHHSPGGAAGRSCRGAVGVLAGHLRGFFSQLHDSCLL